MLKQILNKFLKIMFLTVNFTLARLAIDFKFTLVNRKFHSPWRVWRVLISTPANDMSAVPLFSLVVFVL